MKLINLNVLSLIIGLCLTTTLHAQTGIFYSKHNLSAGGSGSIKASGERQVCVFCHAPHSTSGMGQLWNRYQPNTPYILYGSDRLTSISYSAPDQPNEKSKRCLSCHDGMIAIGAVYNGPGGSSSIAMQNNVTNFPTSSSGYIGTDLSNDHPVGYQYDPSKDPELVPRSWPWNTPVKLDPDASNGKVECTTCHEPHSIQYEKMLRMSNMNAQLCLFCHNKTNWSFSIHKTSTQSYTPQGSSSMTTVGEWACRNCHQSHNGMGKPYLLHKSEEQTCYDSGCHGSVNKGANTKNIQSEFQKNYSHPVNRTSGKHVNPDDASSLSISNRHAECVDCHDPHQARKGLHSLKSNLVSNVLTGADGVDPIGGAAWTQPTSFTQMKPATKEYQICLRCHSFNGFGFAANGIYSMSGPSGIMLTDQAMEINPANKSFHPVQQSKGSGALTSNQMTRDWNSPGRQTMYCSDCHGNDQQVSATAPQGPHGSVNKFMLKGSTAKPNARYWPTKQDGVTLWSLLDIKNNTNNARTELFCFACHTIYDTSWKNKAHEKDAHQKSNIYCITCHVVVPHGSRRSRLIGYASEPAPYNWGGTGFARLVISGFQKMPPGYYEKNSCSTPSVRGCHGAQTNRYEP